MGSDVPPCRKMPGKSVGTLPGVAGGVLGLLRETIRWQRTASANLTISPSFVSTVLLLEPNALVFEPVSTVISAFLLTISIPEG